MTVKNTLGFLHLFMLPAWTLQTFEFIALWLGHLPLSVCAYGKYQSLFVISSFLKGKIQPELKEATHATMVVDMKSTEEAAGQNFLKI